MKSVGVFWQRFYSLDSIGAKRVLFGRALLFVVAVLLLGASQKSAVGELTTDALLTLPD